MVLLQKRHKNGGSYVFFVTASKQGDLVNHLEDWHARLNKYVGRKNPSLVQVLHFLAEETKIRIRSKTIKFRNYQEIDTEINSAGHCLEIISTLPKPHLFLSSEHPDSQELLKHLT